MTIVRIALVLGFAAAGASAAHAQQSDVVFDAGTVVIPDSRERMNALVDLDGDAFPDAVGYYYRLSTETGVFGFVNDGQGRFSKAWQITVLPGTMASVPPAGFDAADMTGDGKVEIALAVRNRMNLWTGAGTSAPAPMLQVDFLPSTNDCIDLVIGNFDGHQDVDVAVLTELDLRIYNRLFTASPGSFFSLPLAHSNAATIDVIDANGDGQDDVMVTDGTVSFYRTIGATLAPISTFATGFPDAGAGAVGDVDGDLDEDVVLFSSTGVYRVLRRVAPSSFTLEPANSGGPATALVDVDLDGVLDGIGAGGAVSSGSNTQSSPFDVAFGDGTGGFAPAIHVGGLGANEIAGAADVDGDGDVDLVAGRCVYYNVDGIRGAPPVADGPAGGAAAALVDFDRDGDVDARFTLDQARANLGDGTFITTNHVPAVPPDGGSFVGPGFPGDFDGDGDVDLIVEHHTAGAFVSMRLLKNNGGGGLSDAGPAAAPGVKFYSSVVPEASLRADFTGDGIADVSINSTFSDPIASSQLYRNDGHGFFTTWFGYLGEKVEHVGDVTGDGVADTISLGSTVFLRAGTGNGLFGSKAAIVQQPPASNQFFALVDRLAFGDLDDDGDTDVIVVINDTANGGIAHVLENVGGGSFVDRPNLFPEFRGGSNPFVGDLDGDGRDDVTLGNVFGHGLSQAIYLQTSAPGLTFEFRGIQPFGIAGLSDVDGDGDADALFSAVVRNRTFTPPDGGFRSQFGAGTAGTSGQVPTLGASGPFRFGETAALNMTGVRPNTFGIFVFGLSSTELANAPVLGTTLYVLPILGVVNLPFPGNPAEFGSGGLSVPFNVPPGAVGNTWFHQFFAADPGAIGGASASNALELYYGP